MRRMIILVALVAVAAGLWIMGEWNRGAELPESAFGTWESPLGARQVFAGADAVSFPRSTGDGLYFVESRAAEGGRDVLVRLIDEGALERVSPADFDVRNRVHEMGGLSYAVAEDAVFYANFVDQKLYRQSTGSDLPVALTPEGLRYGECLVDEAHHLLICVREDHRAEGEAVNTLVAVDMNTGGAGEILFSGTDFVTAPRLSPDGKTLAWVVWTHPNMPWDHTQIMLADIGDGGALENTRAVPELQTGSMVQPLFAPDGTLYFVADWTGWWNLYRLDGTGNPVQVLDMKAEFSFPDWQLGQRSYAFLDDGSMLVSYTSGGLWYLGHLDPNAGTLAQIGDAYANIGHVVAGPAGAYFIAATPTRHATLYRLAGDNIEIVHDPAGPELDPAYVSLPEALSYPTGDGEVAHGFFYPPINSDFKAPEGSHPPLVVMVHGGPTGATNSGFRPSIQYWTTRGFAVFDLNYRGSTGFGRAYRISLYQKWGVADVEDATLGAKWLADQGRVDGTMLAIRGGSAGGFTVLAALAFHDVFNAATSYFGISDLEALAQDTHKFESRYIDQVIGPYPQEKARYVERSPIHSVDGITVPLMIFQGLDDKIVPPNQSEMIYRALREKCIPTAYISYPGEAHGFRVPANNIRALEAELAFYGQVFGFTPAGDIQPIELETCK